MPSIPRAYSRQDAFEMQTRFSADALRDPAMASSEGVIRKCVHCGFCTATCPTYVLLGDELDSPRGRIYLIKEMLENEREPTAEVVKHVDRCLSCLSCMTTCSSGVNYMHLVDHARAYIADRYRRPFKDRMVRSILAWVLPYPRRFRLALRLARLARYAAPLIGRIDALQPVSAMLALAPSSIPPAASVEDAPATVSRGRVALLGGCAEPVLRPEFRAAAVRLLNRLGHRRSGARRFPACGSEFVTRAGGRTRPRHVRQKTTTLRMLSPACIRSNPLLISSSVRTWVIIGSIAILPFIYQSTIFGTSVRPLAPPNAVPFHTRPVTSWNGRVEISLPASATPMMMLSPQPRWQHSSAVRITSVLPVASKL